MGRDGSEVDFMLEWHSVVFFSSFAVGLESAWRFDLI